MLASKLNYEPPSIVEIGAFEVLTRGGTSGTTFDGTFVHGQPVPINIFGPLIFS